LTVLFWDSYLYASLILNGNPGEQASKFGITLALGSYYRPNGEASAWVRINTGHADDSRAIRFFKHMGRHAGKR
jgi:hypothetical protein